jgi:putative pyoverdin transport system ATP-binding/permease protein
MIKAIRFWIRSAKTIQYSKAIVFIVFIAGMIGGAANAGVLAIINKAIANAGRSSNLIVPFAGIFLLLGFSKLLSQVLMVRFATQTVADVRLHLSRRILSTPLRQLEQIGPDRLLATITEDIPSVMTVLTQAPTLCLNLVIVLGCLGYTVWLSWKLFLLIIASLLLAMAGYHLLEKRSSSLFAAARTESNLLLKSFRGLISGTKELQMYPKRQQEFLAEGIKARANRLAEYRIAATTNYAIAEAWGESMVYVLIGLLLFLFSGFKGVNTMVLTGYVLVFLYMVTPLQFILNVLPTISQADIAIDRIEKLDLKLIDPKATPLAEGSVFKNWQVLELDKVTLTYEGQKDNTQFTLGPISLRIHAGEIVFVTGGNGSGKTTLIKILTGLYVPQSGEISLDGNQITSQDYDAYKQLFSVVFADFFLFDELYGLRGKSAEANEFLSYLQLDHKVHAKDGALSTVDLSQGQRRRLALLVAYLEDHSIYVFDEWAADQDPYFREVFYLKLLPDLKRKGKTVIVISHDDRYYHLGDRVIKLEYGKLEKEYTPSEKDRTASTAAAR